MIIDVINNEKRELTVGLIHHITGWYVKCMLPFGIDYSWSDDLIGNRHKQLTVDFLCFSIYIEYWRWNETPD